MIFHLSLDFRNCPPTETPLSGGHFKQYQYIKLDYKAYCNNHQILSNYFYSTIFHNFMWLSAIKPRFVFLIVEPFQDQIITIGGQIKIYRHSLPVALRL